MAWWGKFFGGAFGFMLGGPLGALLGAALGHHFDSGLKGLADDPNIGIGDHERIQTAFFTATFSVMGHVAKADGRVTTEEIKLAEALMAQMRLTPDQRSAAMNLFQEGKRAGFPLDDVLEQFRRECHRRATLIRMFLEMQIQAAVADGHVDPEERRLLLHIAQHLGFSQRDFEQLLEMIFGAAGGTPDHPYVPSLNDSYKVLGVSKSVNDAELKRAYRRLMSQHHPDKLVSKGLPEEMIKVATEKTQQIRSAYEKVRDARARQS